MDEKFGKATRSGILEVDRAYGPTVPHLTARPVDLTDERPRARRIDGPGEGADHGSQSPMFAAPGLVLVTAMAIFGGYHWLHLLPAGSLLPASLVFAVVAVPATFALTLHLSVPRIPWMRTVARASSVVVLVLGASLALNQTTYISRVLGVASLVLAASLVCLVVDSERRRWPETGDA